MSVAIGLTPNNVSIVETLWTMLRPLDSNIRMALGKRLVESAKNKEATASNVLSDKIKGYVVSPFVSTLPVKSELDIPEDENGMDALLELKYGI